MNMHIVKNTKSPNKRKKKTIITLILTGIGQSVSAKEITAIPIGLFRLMSMPNMDQANLRDPKNQDHMEDHHEDSPKLMLRLMQNLIC